MFANPKNSTINFKNYSNIYTNIYLISKLLPKFSNTKADNIYTQISNNYKIKKKINEGYYSNKYLIKVLKYFNVNNSFFLKKQLPYNNKSFSLLTRKLNLNLNTKGLNFNKTTILLQFNNKQKLMYPLPPLLPSNINLTNLNYFLNNKIINSVLQALYTSFPLNNNIRTYKFLHLTTTSYSYNSLNHFIT